jgi:hypothetical protein
MEQKAHLLLPNFVLEAKLAKLMDLIHLRTTTPRDLNHHTRELVETDSHNHQKRFETIRKLNHRVTISGTLTNQVPLFASISKRKKHVGYLDAMIRVQDQWNANVEIGIIPFSPYTFIKSEESYTVQETVQKNITISYDIFFIIKVNPEPIHMLLRQLNLYRKYLSLNQRKQLILLTTENFKLKSYEKEMLQQNEIMWLYCSQTEFEEWLQKKKNEQISDAAIECGILL